MEKAYWKCPNIALPKDALFFISVLMNVFSLLLNLSVLVLLLLLKGRPLAFLTQMRTLIGSVVFFMFIRICDRVIPRRLYPSDPMFASILCHIWTSRYVFFVTYKFTILVLNFTVGNRAIQIVCRYQHSFSTSRITSLAYLAGMGLVSVVCMLPQALIVEWNGKNCRCLDADLPYGVLVALYTETFVRFGLTAFISTTILIMSCYKIIQWMRSTRAEQLSDTWNILALPGTTKEQMEAFSRPQGWLTATLCTVPLSVNFLVISLYETGYKFICALGFCTITMDSPLSRAARFLLDFQLLVLPTIFIVYIPALRESSMHASQRVVSLGKNLCKRQRETSVVEQPDARMP
ncbi:hypothetical protein AAHC03_09380 [Spirometra sp. Aus1]